MIPATSQSTLPQGRWLLQKQTCPYPTRWRSQPHQLTPPPKQVWRRGRFPWSVTLSMFLPLQPHTAATVKVQCADLTELQENANLAADHMLSVKRSMDLKRRWVIWKLGVLLHWNKVKEAVANEKAKVLHSQEVLDAKVDCAKVVLEAKYNYRVAIQEAKMIRGNHLQELKIAHSKVPWQECHCEVFSICNTPQGTCKAHA